MLINPMTLHLQASLGSGPRHLPTTVTHPAGGRERSVPPQSLLHRTADRLPGVAVLWVGEAKPS